MSYKIGARLLLMFALSWQEGSERIKPDNSLCLLKVALIRLLVHLLIVKNYALKLYLSIYECFFFPVLNLTSFVCCLCVFMVTIKAAFIKTKMYVP